MHNLTKKLPKWGLGKCFGSKFAAKSPQRPKIATKSGSRQGPQPIFTEKGAPKGPQRVPEIVKKARKFKLKIELFFYRVPEATCSISGTKKWLRMKGNLVKFCPEEGKTKNKTRKSGCSENTVNTIWKHTLFNNKKIKNLRKSLKNIKKPVRNQGSAKEGLPRPILVDF